MFSFLLYFSEVKTIVNKTDAFDNICEICGTPDFNILAIGENNIILL